MAPDRSSTTPAGSDIVLDALLEEQVARQAREFYRSMQQGPPGGAVEKSGSEKRGDV